ncbi:endonuclease/exonuclease/phosphatase family protein [Massilia antarctica]|uniref:endonuclease/exonuclease/phosphatase family protein n=1 Tax=Massilia antarctica TaxID=2765360 RepID=UPI0006BB622E|nr:endonuclease/exonuclease/phosphatase family protein [Massilia sp. H27-R4]MCY0913786.1 endonuclease/exonuclease/phosphatase family protein [Massilia sp. H27-R4]CUI04491.1 Metal-dependent hydrolase [Janthinobacterium sp. CG23_2]CUU28277.1 Metal-dependent hydrolase [Janthinobacterium sp. CG23_2]
MNLITWNIQRGRTPGGECDIARTVASLRAVADADVICLQEVSSGYTEAAAHAAHPRVGAAAGPFSATPRGGAALLAGDCNFLPGSWEYHCPQAPFDDGTPAWVDAWRLRHPDQAHAPTVCLHDHPGRPADPFTCDFVFVSDDLAPRVAAVRVAPDDFGPDHQPLAIRLV